MRSNMMEGTFMPAQLPLGLTALTSRFVFEKKRAADCYITRYNIRLVGHGYKQKHGKSLRTNMPPSLLSRPYECFGDWMIQEARACIKQM